MATALAAVRLQPWQPEYNVGDVPKMESFKGGRVRAFGEYPNKSLGKAQHQQQQQQQQNRGKICKVPLFRTSSPRREALTSAMSEEHDITDMRETDKVSGEWWKPVLTAVRDWSHDKLLGLAELADGSLVFSFGPGSDSKASARPAKASSSSSSSSPQKSKRAAQSGGAAASRSTNNNLKTPPQRYPSSFRKLSPIPASRKKTSEFKTEKEVSSSPSAAAAAAAAEGEDKKPLKKQRAKSPSKSAAQPRRPASSFFKRSPIPKERVSTDISKKKNQETETASTTAAVDPATDSPFSPKLKEIVDQSKESEKKSTKTASARTPSKKKAAKAVVREVETVVEVTALTSSGADSGKEKSSSVAAAESEGETVVDVVVAAAPAAAANGSVSQDLGSFKLPELRSLAKARGLKGYSKLKKGELVDLLAGLES